MKKIINTFLILFLLSNLTFAQEIDCVRKTHFGEVEICLPEIEGYQECYMHPVVKEIADGTEMPSNVVLGFYLNNEVFEKKDSLGFFNFEDFFKIYSVKGIKDQKANAVLLKQLQDVLAGNFISKNWDAMKKEIDKIELGIEIGAPTVIKSYNLNEKSFTYVMLTKYKVEGSEPHTLAMTINGLLINERFIFMAYYLNYNGAESILNLQEKSNLIITKLLEKGN